MNNAIEKKTQKNIKNEYKNENTNNVYPLWVKQLDRFETSGKIKGSFSNFKAILDNDEEFAGKIEFNEFSYQPCFNKKPITDNTLTNIVLKIEKKYDGINNIKILEPVLELVAEEHKYNPIVDYLNSLKWDGVPRVATALSDYFGCAYSRYNEYCFRTFLNGAISRALEPGVKFDYMLTLVGDQGQGKSTFFRHLCGKDEYYQDNLDDFEGKKAFEKTENKWMVEAAEMTYMSKNNIEKIKAFITTRKDTVRYTYKRYSTDVYRRFVLLGTTNNPEFLTDKTGNRRFLIVNVKAVDKPKKSIFSDTIQQECDQIMAEAYQLYLKGENFLVMPEEFEQQILDMQNEHMIYDSKEGMINDYLEKRMLILKEKDTSKWGFKKYYCCVKQLYVEALQHKFTDAISRAESNDIALILQKNPHWRKCGRDGKRINTGAFDNYGTQKAYEYVYDIQEEKVENLDGNDYINSALQDKVKQGKQLGVEDFEKMMKQKGIKLNVKEIK